MSLKPATMTGVAMPALRLLPAALLITLPLAACSKGADKQATASGEILPGSASDAMLPEDRLTSQPPLDPGAVRRSGGAAAPEATGSAAAEDAAPAEAATAAAVE
jgi:hypothetical protein